MSSNDKNICKEYNSLKYKTMIMTGNNLENKEKTHESKDLDNFLFTEMLNHKKQSWSKLTKTDRIKKIKDYMNNTIKDNYNLNETEYRTNLNYLLNLIDRKKINKSNEIFYDDNEGKILEINAVIFNDEKRKFTLNKNIKKTDSIKNKPASKKKTIKKKPETKTVKAEGKQNKSETKTTKSEIKTTKSEIKHNKTEAKPTKSEIKHTKTEEETSKTDGEKK